MYLTIPKCIINYFENKHINNNSKQSMCFMYILAPGRPGKNNELRAECSCSVLRQSALCSRRAKKLT